MVAKPDCVLRVVVRVDMALGGPELPGEGLGVGGVDEQGRAITAIEDLGHQCLACLAVLHQRVVGRLAHERDQLVAVGAKHRFGGSVGVGVAAAVPVEVMSAGTPTATVVFGDDHDVAFGAVGKFLGVEIPTHRNLPAHLGFRLDEGHSLRLREVMERATVAAGEVPGVVEDARAVDDSGGALLLTGLHRDSVTLADGSVLPHLLRELLRPVQDAFLILSIGEVGPERAAAGLGRIRVDSFAALTEDAVVAGGQPGEIAAEPLVFVAGVVELHPGSRKVEGDLGGSILIDSVRVAHFGHHSTLGGSDAGSVIAVRLGVLDVGSNTVHLLIVDAHYGAAPIPASKSKIALRLAEHLDERGCIDSVAVDSLVGYVHRSLEVAEDLGVTEMLAFATSAIRDAPNGAEVLQTVQERTGVTVTPLSGEEEARLTFLAVRRWFGWSAGRIMVVDIGGGSLEIATGADEEPDVAVSLPLGAGRLTRDFCRSDPPEAEQIRELRRHVRAQIADVAGRLMRAGEPRLAVATSKTMRQLARITGAAPSTEGPHVRRVLTRDDLAIWVPKLAAMTSAERARLPGVSDARAPQLVAGAIVAESVMDLLSCDSFDIGPWALREGVILRRLDGLER